jgi:hypothetical protein
MLDLLSNPRFKGSLDISTTTTWYYVSLNHQFAKENYKIGMSSTENTWRT